MKNTIAYVFTVVITCSLIYAGMMYEKYKTTQKTEERIEVKPVFSDFDFEEFIYILVTKGKSVHWGQAAIDSLFGMYNLVNDNIQPSNYPIFLSSATNDFNDRFESTNVEMDMRHTTMHQFQYLYLNHLYLQLPDKDQKGKLEEVINAYQTWEAVLIGLHSNNVLLGSCSHRFYTFECADIAYDALENLCMLLYWIESKQKGTKPDMEVLEKHERRMSMEDYYEKMKITKERLEEMEELEHEPHYISIFEDESFTVDTLTPEIGDRIFEMENTAFEDLRQTLNAYAKAGGWNKQWQSELDEYLTTARYNVLYNVSILKY